MTEGQPPPPPADSYCCRWYASYWNAFLWLLLLCVLTRRSFYHPQHSCGKLMFSQASVILFTEGVSARHPLGRHPQVDSLPEQIHPLGRPPQEDIPLPPGRHPSQQTATAVDGTHPLECILVYLRSTSYCLSGENVWESSPVSPHLFQFYETKQSKHRWKANLNSSQMKSLTSSLVIDGMIYVWCYTVTLDAD